MVDGLLRNEGLDVQRVRKQLIARHARRAALSGVLDATPLGLLPGGAAPAWLNYETHRRALLACLLYLEDPQFFERDSWQQRLAQRSSRAEKKAAHAPDTGFSLGLQGAKIAGQLLWPLARRRLLNTGLRMPASVGIARRLIGKAIVIQAVAQGVARYIRLRREAAGFEVVATP